MKNICKVENEEIKDFSDIKVEPEDPDTTLYTRGQSWPRRGRNFRRGRGGRNTSRFGSARFTPDRQCFICGAGDHLSYDCPKKLNNSDNTGTQGASGSGGMGRCFKCNSPDHFAYACPMAVDAGASNVKPVKLTLLGMDI